MKNKENLEDSVIADGALSSDGTMEVCEDVAYKRIGIVNVCYVGPRGCADRGWVLIDAGVAGSADIIAGAAEERFGKNIRPSAIVLTHGHFDHVGAVETLSREWDVPVFAHVLEGPYLDGSASYPPPDPSVGGGVMARLSPLFPRRPIDLGLRLRELPHDGSIPGLEGWKWIHTPGHTPGHVALWRASDKVLIAGDAIITTKQESVYAVMMQSPYIEGPPKYYTQDWEEAEQSVRKLESLAPEFLITGHGRAMRGESMRQGIHKLSTNFGVIAVPQGGKYAENPARPYH